MRAIPMRRTVSPGRSVSSGAGAAGITLARELSKTLPDVVLVEAGGMEIDGQTQGLYAGRQLGLPYFNLSSCRLRFFGGTTNHWSGYCRANDPIDYERRPEAGLPGWPFSADDLAPFVDRAAESLGIASEFSNPAQAVADAGFSSAALVGGEDTPLETKVFQIAEQIRLGPLNAEDFAAAENLQNFLYLNLTHIQLAEDGSEVRHVEAATLNGRKVRIKARAYVLCCHAIENARLLLASDDVMSAGIGNDHDLVGRYFMDHIHIHASRFVPSPSFPKVYNAVYAKQRNVNANIGFSDAFLRDNGLLQYYCRFNPKYLSDAGAEALENLAWNYKQPGDLDFLADVAQVMTELSGAVKYEMMRKDLRYSAPDYYTLEHRLEQAPNPDSRVVLSERRDALGSRIADLDWRINDFDVRSFAEGQAALGREMAALGYGRIEEEEITRELVEDRLAGHYHHIGTTKMSDDPSSGVVDANCRVHGVSNLYVGGSSTFPTAGYSGPTMMLIAMAMRLSDHLKTELDQGNL